MKCILLITVIITLSFVGNAEGAEMKGNVIKLPAPSLKGEVSLEEAMAGRRSVREYSGDSLSLEEISQLLWAGQGITKDNLYRTAPSAGALYPLELYVVAEKVEGLKPGLYHYLPKGHKIKLVKKGKLLKTLAEAALGQKAIHNCSAAFIITGIVKRTSRKYGERAELFVHIEVGHTGQNILLQAEAMGLGAVPMGAFYEERVKAALGLEGEPFYIIPAGRK